MKLIPLQYAGERKGSKGHMLRITPAEALRIIESLAAQLRTGNPNVARAEFGTEADYLSVSVEVKP